MSAPRFPVVASLLRPMRHAGVRFIGITPANALRLLHTSTPVHFKAQARMPRKKPRTDDDGPEPPRPWLDVKFLQKDPPKPKKDKSPHAETVFLPSTPFQMEAKAAIRERFYRRRTTQALYDWQREHFKDRPTWFLQDGPPYANGQLHMGHLLNKVLKDISVRYHLLRGKRVFHRPGWDTHGLPIENKVAGNKVFSGTPLWEADPVLVRQQAAEYAAGQVQRQSQDFQLLGILADWKDPYCTYTADYETKQLQVFAEMVKNNLIYRADKPVYYSPQSRTALADAELEYFDGYVARTVFVRFPLTAGKRLLDAVQDQQDREALRSGKVDAVIWTTTPWSLPGNLAMAVNPNIEYCIARPKSQHPLLKDKVFIMATNRVQWFARRKAGLAHGYTSERERVGEFDITSTFTGADLIDSTYRHPFLTADKPNRPILPADYVTDISGTGLVHTAPAHGMEDYHLCVEHGIIQGPSASPSSSSRVDHVSGGILSPIDDDGLFTSELGDLNPDLRQAVGQTALGTGGGMINKWLGESGWLVVEMPLVHRTARDWRTKTPVLMRATPQWFVDIGAIKPRAHAAIQKVEFIPASSKRRLENVVASRNEWCISRQRWWGVPIPVVYDVTTGQPLLTYENVQHIISVFREKGTDWWYRGPAQDFVAPQYRREGAEWAKGRDTMDVWFDSGASWAASNSSPALRGEGEQETADLYLEGTDQHRGWFQSSLLTRVAVTPEGQDPEPPYKRVATHGWVLNRRHEKMSKSEGNFIDPVELILGGPKIKMRAWGADTMRLWAAKAYPWESNCNVSQLRAKWANLDLRRLRNVARFMLSVLPPQSEVPKLDDPGVQSALTLLDRALLSELHTIDANSRRAYEDLDYPGVVRPMMEFAATRLSSFYFDVTKDALYSDGLDSPRRRAVVAVLDTALNLYLSILAPVVPHIVEEAWHYRRGGVRDPPEVLPEDAPREESFFESGWHGVGAQWADATASRKLAELELVRDEVLRLLEEGRNLKVVSKPAEIDVEIELPDVESGEVRSGLTRSVVRLLREYHAQLPELFKVSRVTLITATGERLSQPQPPAHIAPALRHGHRSNGAQENDVVDDDDDDLVREERFEIASDFDVAKAARAFQRAAARRAEEARMQEDKEEREAADEDAEEEQAAAAKKSGKGGRKGKDSGDAAKVDADVEADVEVEPEVEVELDAEADATSGPPADVDPTQVSRDADGSLWETYYVTEDVDADPDADPDAYDPRSLHPATHASVFYDPQPAGVTQHKRKLKRKVKKRRRIFGEAHGRLVADRRAWVEGEGPEPEPEPEPERGGGEREGGETVGERTGGEPVADEAHAPPTLKVTMRSARSHACPRCRRYLAPARGVACPRCVAVMLDWASPRPGESEGAGPAPARRGVREAGGAGGEGEVGGEGAAPAQSATRGARIFQDADYRRRLARVYDLRVLGLGEAEAEAEERGAN